jgi:hypothetical protein
MYRKGGW